jgi:Tol biopolymer transport system component
MATSVRWTRGAYTVVAGAALVVGAALAAAASGCGSSDAYAGCAPTAAFVLTVRNDVVSSDQNDSAPALSADGLSLYFTSDRPGSAGDFDLYVARREHAADAFSPPTPIDEINTPANEDTPFVTPDGLTLYFSSNRPGGLGAIDLYVARRSSPTGKFGPPVNLAALNAPAPARQFSARLAADGRTMYFASDRAGSIDIYRAIEEPPGHFSAPEPVAEVDTAYDDASPWPSRDGLALYFASNRAAGGTADLWVARRAHTTDRFGAPEPLAGVNSDSFDGEPSMSAEGCTLFFSSARPGSSGETDIWEAYRVPVR